MTRRLFLGGKSHGRWVDVDDELQVEIPHLTDTFAMREETYRRRVMTLPGNQPRHVSFYVLDGLPDPRPEAVVRLFSLGDPLVGARAQGWVR